MFIIGIFVAFLGVGAVGVVVIAIILIVFLLRRFRNIRIKGIFGIDFTKRFHIFGDLREFSRREFRALIHGLIGALERWRGRRGRRIRRRRERGRLESR